MEIRDLSPQTTHLSEIWIQLVLAEPRGCHQISIWTHYLGVCGAM